MSEDAGKTRKRRKRNRRSLRVPVDEVPRPTVATQPELEAIEDGGATVEIPAFIEDPRNTIENVAAEGAAEDSAPPAAEAESVVVDESLLDEDLLGAPRQDDGEPGELEGEPTVAQAPPSDDDLDDAPTLVREESVEVTLDSESVELDDLATGADSEPPAPEEAPEPTEEQDDDDDEPELEVEEPAEEPEPEAEDDEPAEHDSEDDYDDNQDEVMATPAVAQVLVSRVVNVIGSDSIPPPPPPDSDEIEVAAASEEVALDDEEIEDFEVEVDEDYDGYEELEDDDEPELTAEELEEEELGEEELEDDEHVPGRAHPSKPPPPPAAPVAAKAAAAKAAPPPPPEKEPEAAPPAAPPSAAKPAPKKSKRQWWEHLFNDDYLRTVPIPHPKVVQRQCDFIEQRFGLARGATILDVGCGLGAHAVELTRRGYLVVGLDLSLPMLSRAADEAQEHGYKINFLHADMRDMSFEGAFDAVLCWGTTFGYFDDDTNRLVVERLHQALKPRGLLLLDVVNRDYVVRTQPNLLWFEGDGCVVMEETTVNYITSRLRVKRNVILDDGRQRDTRYSVRLYALHELGQMLHHKGFRVVEVSGREAHPGVYFGADSPRLIILAERRPQAPQRPSGMIPVMASERPPAPSEQASVDEDISQEIVAEEIDEEEIAAELDDESPVAEGSAPPEPPSSATSEALAEALEQSEEELDSQEAHLEDLDDEAEVVVEEIDADED